MIRSIETTGKTKELAIRAALEQLKLTEDDITYEILELGRSGFLGIGAVPARVRVSYDDGQSEPKPVKTQYLALEFRSLPTDSEGVYRAWISEVTVK